MKYAYILMLESDQVWVDKVKGLLEKEVASFHVASSLAEAKHLLSKHFFTIAIVDISLSNDDTPEQQGMLFLRTLADLRLDEVISTVILSDHNAMQLQRSAFRDFRVLDCLPKEDFQPAELRELIANALAVRKCLEPLTIDFEPLSPLWNHLSWSQLENEQELTCELEYLLRRIFDRADRLILQRMPSGWENTGLIQAVHFYGSTHSTSTILKIDTHSAIEAERKNYDEFVEQTAADKVSTRLKSECGRLMGVATYTLVGCDLYKVMPLAAYFSNASVQEIQRLLDNIFLGICSRWYENREQPRRTRNLVDLYIQERPFDSWENTWADIAQFFSEVDSPVLTFSGISGYFDNPKHWLEEQNYRINFLVWQAITYGALDEYNLLVTEDSRPWLINFYKTGIGHILRDIIELECVIKFSMIGITDLSDRYILERQLLSQQRPNTPVAIPIVPKFAKPIAVLNHLRRFASDFTDPDMKEYNSALLLYTLHLLSINQSQGKDIQHLLLSAAMICTQLSGHELVAWSQLAMKMKKFLDLAGLNTSQNPAHQQLYVQEFQLDLFRTTRIWIQCFDQNSQITASAIDDVIGTVIINAPGKTESIALIVYSTRLDVTAIRRLADAYEESRITIVPLHESQLDKLLNEAESFSLTRIPNLKESSAITQLQRDAAFSALSNVIRSWRYRNDLSYETLDSLTNPQWFFGEQRIRLKENLATATKQGAKYLYICGMRRSGKSTLLRQLLVSLQHNGVIVGHMLCKRNGGAWDVNAVLSELKSALVRELQAQCEDIDDRWLIDAVANIPIVDFAETLRMLDTLTQRLMGRSFRIVISLDEFDAFQPRGNYEVEITQYVDLVNQFKEVFERCPEMNLTYIFVSEYPWFDRLDRFPNTLGLQNPLYQRFAGEILTEMEWDGWCGMMTSIGLLSGVSFEENCLKELHKLTAGHPEISRQLGRCIVVLLRSNRVTNPVTVSHISTVIAEYFDPQQMYSSYLSTTYWENPLSPDLNADQTVFQVLAQYGKASREELAFYAQDKIDIDACIERLLSLHLIKRQEVNPSHFQLSLPLLGEWIRVTQMLDSEVSGLYV